MQLAKKKENNVIFTSRFYFMDDFRLADEINLANRQYGYEITYGSLVKAEHYYDITCEIISVMEARGITWAVDNSGRLYLTEENGTTTRRR